MIMITILQLSILEMVGNIVNKIVTKKKNYAERKNS